MPDSSRELENFAYNAPIQASTRRPPLITRSLNYVSVSISTLTLCMATLSARLHHALDRAACILEMVSFTLLVELLLFWQPRLHHYAVDSITDDAGHLYLAYLIDNAKSKIKMSVVLLSLAFTMMQMFFNGSWVLLGAVLYMTILSLFMSIVLHTVAILSYEAIQQNTGGANWLLSHARAMRNTPLALDPWIALSIPSAWTFWAFILFFMVMVMTAWDQSPTPPPSLSARAMSTGPRAEVIAAALTVLILGFICAVVMAMTWRRYMEHPRRNIEH